VTTSKIASWQGTSTISIWALVLSLALCGTAALAQSAAASPPTEKIVSISVCSPTGTGESVSCPPGSFDTHQIVLNPDGTSINEYFDAASDEHSSVFSPGTLDGNGDYLFFLAGGTRMSLGPGAVVASGGARPDENGQWTFDFPTADGYGYYGPGPTNFGHVLFASTAHHQCSVVANPVDQDQTFDMNYAAPGSVVKDPTAGPGHLLMIYEGCNDCIGSSGGPKSGEGAYISVGVATSIDFGRTWPTYRGTSTFEFVPLPDANPTQCPDAPFGALGQSVCMGNDCTTPPPASYGRYAVLAPPVSLAWLTASGHPPSDAAHDSEPSAFVDDAGPGPDRYVYEVHCHNPGNAAGSQDQLPDGRDRDLTVARAKLNGGTAPLQFLKWDGQSFSQPGIGGHEAQILPDGAFENCGDLEQARSAGSISYVVPTQQYLLTFVCHSPTDPAGGKGKGGASGAAWFYATTDDLSHQHWSTPQEITGSWSEWAHVGCPSWKGWYPTFMSLGRKPGFLSVNGYVFYLWGCLAGGAETPGSRRYSSRAFSITTGPIHPIRRRLRRTP